MEFLKAFFGDKAITYDELVQAINAYNGDEKNKEKLIKMVNLKVLHPNGLSLAVDQIAKESPTYAELGESANYSLKFNTKNVKMGLIKSKVGTAVV